MELREYWTILSRRWPLVAVVTLITLVASTLMVAFGPTLYKAEFRLTVSVKPEPRQGNYYMYDQYYTWLTSEYLVDDFGEVIKSDAFAKDVAQRLGESVPADAIKRDLNTKKTHRILTVTVTTSSPQRSQDIANAMKDVMESKARDYFAQLSTGDAMMRVIDDPKAEPEMGLLRRILEIVLRTAVGFLAAVGLAFLLNYLDPTLRSREETERVLELPVLAEVPR